MEKLEKLKSWFVKNSKIIMPVILAVCVIITIVISVSANKREEELGEGVEVNNIVDDETNGGESDDVQEILLKENDSPEIKELIENYYAAQVTGDMDAIRALVDILDDSEAIRIEETSKYIESFPALDIYTKPGPVENSYLVYISLKEKFRDYDNPIPGMEVYYVCVDESGRYYICNSDNGDESELEYIRIASLQDDVIDLSNKINVEYNNMVADDEDLKQFLSDFKAEIEKKVGEMLVMAEANNATEDGGEDTPDDGEETPQSVTVVTRVKAIDVVNIRSSDSETADKLGKAAIGDEFKLIEKIDNGWSKVEYEGKSAYIKSMYLEDVEFAEVDTETETPANTQVGSDAVTGTVTATANVRIRSEASETSEKLGLAYKGQKLDLIAHQDDGWTRIRYNGHVAYVKSDYVKSED
ncbi:MAG: SH3 domain-containing protein [Lachnospiraceae bacterium]|nr:SH3 domain-containing protein [Lachnospiraceae bacterium]